MTRIDITNKKPSEVLELLGNGGHIESDSNKVWLVVK